MTETKTPQPASDVSLKDLGRFVETNAVWSTRNERTGRWQSGSHVLMRVAFGDTERESIVALMEGRR